MKIQNHMLSAPADTKLQSPNMGGVITPTVIVLHYTASGGKDGQGDADYLSRASSRASAHVVVGRNGSIDQIVPFNRRAWHAGESSYKGKKDVNTFSIGIEIDNWGWLSNAGLSHSGELVPANLQFAGTRSGHNKWEVYPDAQLKAVEEVIAAIVAEYGIIDIVGHEDIAPGRKQDPGPALDAFKAKMKEKYVETDTEQKPSETKKEASNKAVTTTDVRLRQRPNATTALILTTLAKGRKVEVLHKNAAKGWDHVKIGDKVGYISNQYLTYE